VWLLTVNEHTMDTAAAQEGTEVEERRRRFRAALALAGTTAKGFGLALGVSETHLTAVLRGQRRSARVQAAVDALLAAYPVGGGTPDA
jgi:hypothetical protein